jgi:hypothetical protein
VEPAYSCAFCDETIPNTAREPLGLNLVFGWRECDDPTDRTCWVHVDCFRSGLSPGHREIFDLD